MQCALIGEVPELVGTVSEAVRHRLSPAEISEELVDGGCQLLGSSSTKKLDGIKVLPFESWILNASTRNPLTLPSVPLKRNVSVLVPVVREVTGIVIVRVWNPPPIP